MKSNKEIFQECAAIGVVPVVRVNSGKEVFFIIDALMKSGLPIVEITMTTPDAIKIINQCVREYGDQLVVGGGTIKDLETCKRAVDAGAQFVVTPTANIDVIKFCVQQKTCVIGGALTPTEILSVWQAGADGVKVFPARAVGGPSYIKMIHELMPEVPLIPTGGVTLETLEDYFQAGASFVGTGGDLVGKGQVGHEEAAPIQERIIKYLSAIRKYRDSL
jgi:2-dehydro-3-deoxyphosphogluconate aldolase / (4S)-4-hydroxy-2-oxoglutarate aldolase